MSAAILNCVLTGCMLAIPWLGADAGADDQLDASAQSAGPILLGMSTALTGPASDLGKHVRQGVEVCLAEVNEGGGIRGRPVRLIVYDDGYEPTRTVPNVRRLLEVDRVLAMIGNVGTPTAVATAPLASNYRTLFFAPYTGAAVVRREPPERYVINYRASYAEETAAIIAYLVERRGIRPDQIALFTQADAYGDAGYAGSVQALRRYGLARDARVPHGRYRRNTLDVEGALAELLDVTEEPKAVVMVGAYAPSAKLVRLAHSVGFDPIFCSVSFVGAESLVDALGDEGAEVIVAQVVPHHAGESAAARQYRSALACYGGGASPSFAGFEGYIAGQILAEGLRRVDGPLTRDAVVDSLESMGEYDIGLGFPISLSGADHQASHRVWLTVLRNGEILSLETDTAGGAGGQSR